jgi:hypothetical protein
MGGEADILIVDDNVGLYRPMSLGWALKTDLH